MDSVLEKLQREFKTNKTSVAIDLVFISIHRLLSDPKAKKKFFCKKTK